MRHAQPAVVCVRQARDASVRLESPDEEKWHLRRADLRQVHDVAGAGQGHLPVTQGGVQRVEGTQLMRSPKLPLKHVRQKSEQRDLRAGCHVCSGDTARWTMANAQAVAAQHHDRTGHATWVKYVGEIQYGRAAADPRQTDIEDAIASASSGDRPDVSAPLPGSDAPPVPAVGVSAPTKAALSKRALAAAKPEPNHA